MLNVARLAADIIASLFLAIILFSIGALAVVTSASGMLIAAALDNKGVTIAVLLSALITIWLTS